MKHCFALCHGFVQITLLLGRFALLVVCGSLMVLHEKYAKEPWRHIGLKFPTTAPPPWVQLPPRTPLGHLSGISYGIHFGLTPPGYGATDSTSSHVHDIDIDRRNKTNHASSFVLPLGHLLGTSYGIHTGSTPPWRFWDTVQEIQQAHRFVNTSDASNSVAKSSHASLIIGDFNSKVGCVIAVCVS